MDPVDRVDREQSQQEETMAQQSKGGKLGGQGRTREQLYEEARKRNIKGRSQMSKKQLEKAVAR